MLILHASHFKIILTYFILGLGHFISLFLACSWETKDLNSRCVALLQSCAPEMTILGISHLYDIIKAGQKHGKLSL